MPHLEVYFAAARVRDAQREGLEIDAYVARRQLSRHLQGNDLDLRAGLAPAAGAVCHLRPHLGASRGLIRMHCCI